MTTLAAISADVGQALAGPYPVVYGPPFRVPPAAPCYVVEPPQVSEVLGSAATCRVTAATVDVVCVPQTGTDHAMLLAMADDAITGLGGAVTSGQAEQATYYTEDPDLFVYRLTVEV